jgi:hypothetical protein
MNKTLLKQLIKEEIQKILNEEFPWDKKKGKRYIPEDVIFYKKDRDNFKEHFKLGKRPNGEYILYMSPLMKSALDELTRGRTSYGVMKKRSELSKLVSERLPQDVRSLLKKFTGKLNPNLGGPSVFKADDDGESLKTGMYLITAKIKDILDGDIIFYNPGHPESGQLAYTPGVSE